MQICRMVPMKRDEAWQVDQSWSRGAAAGRRSKSRRRKGSKSASVSGISVQDSLPGDHSHSCDWPPDMTPVCQEREGASPTCCSCSQGVAPAPAPAPGGPLLPLLPNPPTGHSPLTQDVTLSLSCCLKQSCGFSAERSHWYSSSSSSNYTV